MAIVVECTGCHASVRIKEKYAGRRGRCHHCGAPMLVPSPVAPPRDAALRVAPPSSLRPDNGNGHAEAVQPQQRIPSHQPQSVAERQRAILASFQGSIPPHRATLLYRACVFVVALVMVVLPLCYVGLVGLVVYGMFLYASHGLDILERRVGLLYFGPLVAGTILIAFMLKPLFSRRQADAETRSLDPRDEPILFALVDHISDLILAPRPSHIQVDCSVNASAGRRSGAWWEFRQELVLSIGLPLAAGLSVRQLAGVIAHELGHFSQGTAVRLDGIIRSINFWFARVVYDDDRWDAMLVRWADRDRGWLTLIWLLARAMIWLTRKVLWLLMMLGHLTSRFMMRQMEFDADRYEACVGGSEVFSATTRQLYLLNWSSLWVREELSQAWRDGRLVDDLPGLIAAKSHDLPDDLLKHIDESIETTKTGLFDTHPSAAERIASATGIAAPGVCFDERPASEVFVDFAALSKSTTLDYYREVAQLVVEPNQLVSIERFQGKQAKVERQSKAALLYFRGSIPALRTFLSRVKVQPNMPLARLVQVVQSSRRKMDALRKDYDAVSKRQRLLDERWATTRATVAALKASSELGLPDSFLGLDRSGVREEARRIDEELQTAEKHHLPFEDVAVGRLVADLSMLETAELAAQLDDVKRRRRKAAGLLDIGQQLERHFPAMLKLRLGVMECVTLSQSLQAEPVQPLRDRALDSRRRGLRREFAALAAELRRMPYPFRDQETAGSVFDYALPRMPLDDDLGDLIESTMQLIDRVAMLYGRAVISLTEVALEIEAAAGLPQPEEPARPPDAQPIADRTAETIDNRSTATHPGRVAISHRKLRQLEPELYLAIGGHPSIFTWWTALRTTRGRRQWLKHIEEHLIYGDSRAAVVLSTSPLLVAAYTDELDCAVALEFPAELAAELRLRQGSRLLAVNTYDYPDAEGLASDLTPGPRSLGQYQNFTPYIADFLTDDQARLSERKGEIEDDEWARCYRFGKEFLARGTRPRNGRPRLCGFPAAKLDAMHLT